MMRSALVMSLSLPWFIACGSSGSGRKDPAVPPPVKPPVAVLPSQDPETPPALPPGGGTSPTAPGLPVSGPVSPPLTPPAPGSVEAAFVRAQVDGGVLTASETLRTIRRGSTPSSFKVIAGAP
jgi:hypothetical protein